MLCVHHIYLHHFPDYRSFIQASVATPRQCLVHFTNHSGISSLFNGVSSQTFKQLKGLTGTCVATIWKTEKMGADSKKATYVWPSPFPCLCKTSLINPSDGPGSWVPHSTATLSQSQHRLGDLLGRTHILPSKENSHTDKQTARPDTQGINARKQVFSRLLKQGPGGQDGCFQISEGGNWAFHSLWFQRVARL